jgi:hypothetical protein
MAIILQIVGATILTIGVGTISIPAGIILSGVSLILFGLAYERRG